MKILFLLVSMFFHCTQTLNVQKKGFLVMAPSVFLTDSRENICVSLHNNSAPVQVSVSLVGSYSDLELSNNSAVLHTSGCLDLHTPQTEEHMGRLIVRLQSADAELSGNSEQTVHLQSDPLLVLVSTDKPQYKPGQDVRFRVVSLKHTLKPHNKQIKKIWIESPTGVRVQQWTEVEVVKHGVIELNFSLDKEPLLGHWKIKVQHSSSKVVEKSFHVKEYVPAKFDVIVKPSREIFADSKTVTWTVCAKYSYGEIVQGNAHLEITLLESRAADQPSTNLADKLNSFTGCVDLSVEGSALGLSDPLIHPSAIQVTASVTEKGTEVSASTTVQSQVHNQAFALHFQCSQYFKPGLPYKGHIMMRTMEGGAKVGVGEKIQVCVKARYRSQLAMKLLHCWNYTTDFNSQVVFALPDINEPLNVQLIILTATAIEHSTKLYPGNLEVMMLQPSANHNVKPWHSPSHSYADVWTRTTLACETTHGLVVYYSVPFGDFPTPLFHYVIESRGDLVKMGSVKPKEEFVVHSNEVSAKEVSLVRSWKLPVLVTPAMAPRSRVTVYYVRGDGEVVAASTNLVVDRCFQNKVKVRWEELQVSPRQNTHLCIRASPHSICGVSVTDRQLMFSNSSLLKGNEVEKVWEELKKFTLPKPPRDEGLYCKNKQSTIDDPPDYELRRKRSSFMPLRDYSHHVDAITAFDDIGVTVMSNFVLETRPCSKSFYNEEYYSNQRSWIFSPHQFQPLPVMADNLMQVTMVEPSNTADDTTQSLIRDYFPDTWIWSLVDVGREGEVRVNSSAPDSITTWDTRVTCVSETEGLGVAAASALPVFLPFFLDVETPYSLKRGENVTIKVLVYNYMHHSLPVSVVVRSQENDLLTVKPDEVVVFCVDPLSPQSHMLSVSAHTGGMVNLTVEATTTPVKFCGPPGITTRSDTVVKQLIVKIDGHLEQKSQSAFICPSVDKNPSITWDFQLPDVDNLIPGSSSFQFSVVADLFGPALENLDSLVMLPMGCGEQNLAKLAPNIFVLKYMNAIGYANVQLKETALRNIRKGYQRQLTFLRSDGSFSAFGERDEEGSIWLTAAVVKTLSEAKAFTKVDDDVLQQSLVWVTRQQLENGCFPVVGQVFHTDMEEEGAEESTTAAFTALVLANLAASTVELPTSMRTNVELCVAAGTFSTNPGTLALTTLALTRLGLGAKAALALQQLMSLAVVESDVVHWGKPDASLAQNILSTSYAVLSLVELGGPENLLTAQKAVRWIANHRNENGGFMSTQDTVVALEALTKYITSLPVINKTDLVVAMSSSQLTQTFHLYEDIKMVQQRLITSDTPTRVTAAVSGEGCALLQGVWKYNVRQPEVGSQLTVELSSAAVSTVDPCSIQELQLCISASQLTAMALITVGMVTGYFPDKKRLREISHPHIKKWEESDDQIVFYLTQVGSSQICFKLRLVQKFEVADPLAAGVTVIDYYHPEVSTSKSYSLHQCTALPPLTEPLMMSDLPDSKRDIFENFHDVDFELETPNGNEGPVPVFACPPNSTLRNCA